MTIYSKGGRPPPFYRDWQGPQPFVFILPSPLFFCGEAASPSPERSVHSVVHEPSRLESFESRGASSPSPLKSAKVSWRLEGLGGLRRCVGTVVVPRAQLHIEQEKIFTGLVDTQRVGINQQYLYSSGEFLIFAWLFLREKVTFRGILTAQDSSPLDSARVQV